MLQISIVLRTGSASFDQLVSISISLLTLSWGSAKAFYSQRLTRYADPDPPTLTFVIPAFLGYFFIVVPHIFAWTLVLSCAGILFAVPTMAATAIVKYFIALASRDRRLTNK